MRVGVAEMVGVGEMVGVAVSVGVADASGVGVSVCVAVGAGVSVGAGVDVSVGGATVSVVVGLAGCCAPHAASKTIANTPGKIRFQPCELDFFILLSVRAFLESFGWQKASPAGSPLRALYNIWNTFSIKIR